MALVNHLWEGAVSPHGRVVHRLAGRVAIAPGFAADYGRAGIAMLDAYEATAEGRFREGAERIFDVAVTLCEQADGVCLDAEMDGGLDAAEEHEAAGHLRFAGSTIGDSIPGTTIGGNAVIAEFALRLYAVCGAPRQRRAAADALGEYAATAPVHGVLSAGYALALARYRDAVAAPVAQATAGAVAAAASRRDGWC